MIDDELVGIEHGPPNILQGPNRIALAGHHELVGHVQLFWRRLSGKGRHVEHVDLGRVPE